MLRKLFSDTIPITPIIEKSGEAISYQLQALQAQFISDNFDTSVRELLVKSITACNRRIDSNEHIAQYPAYNLALLQQTIEQRFLDYVLNLTEVGDTPVLAQYAFLEEEIAPYNVFILGGNTDSMYVIYENYKDDIIQLELISQLPFIYFAKMQPVKLSKVKTVHDIFEYHDNLLWSYKED